MSRQSEITTILISLVVATVLCVLEFRRAQKQWREFRMAAVLIATAALTVLMIPITYTGFSSTDTSTVIVTTQGVQPDSLKAFQHAAGRTLSVYRADELWKLSSAEQYQIHVFGYGLSDEELQRLPAASQLIPHLTAPSGIVQIHWQQHLLQGQSLQVQGRYNNTGNQPVQLQLSGQHTLLDSCTIAAGSDTVFQLQALPVHKGKALYQLAAISNRDTTATEPVPVEVNTPFPLSVLILASAPGAEYRFLANWLTDNGYGVAARTAISKNRYQYSYANQQQVALEQLTPATLSNFNVVVTDATALQTATAGEQAALREQVASKGLGMVLLADSSNLPDWFARSSFSLQSAGAVPQIPSVSIPGIGNTALPASLPLYITAAAAVMPLFSDAQQHVRIAAGLYGAGQLAVSTLANTYSWQLAGHPQSYAAVWSTLLQQTARPAFTGRQWFTSPALPIVNEPATLFYTTTDTNTVQPLINGQALSPAQQQLLPFVWQGSYWPEHSGWQINLAPESPHAWYAYTPEQWSQVRAAQKRSVTLQRTYLQNNIAAASLQPVQLTRTLSPAFAWALLLLACTFLWWEGKTRYTGRKKR